MPGDPAGLLQAKPLTWQLQQRRSVEPGKNRVSRTIPSPGRPPSARVRSLPCTPGPFCECAPQPSSRSDIALPGLSRASPPPPPPWLQDTAAVTPEPALPGWETDPPRPTLRACRCPCRASNLSSCRRDEAPHTEAETAAHTSPGTEMLPTDFHARVSSPLLSFSPKRKSKACPSVLQPSRTHALGPSVVLSSLPG